MNNASTAFDGRENADDQQTRDRQPLVNNLDVDGRQNTASPDVFKSDGAISTISQAPLATFSASRATSSPTAPRSAADGASQQPHESTLPPLDSSPSSSEYQTSHHLDLAEFPVSELIKMLASLLNKIIAANDQLKQHPPSMPNHSGPSSTMIASILCFHARNIPSIDVQSYLNRILKYCPTSNEVFLSLLVYFDRMSKNALATTGQPFAIDSYNIHRLVIAGVTVASKFFSDIFYTNSRYAKVGGLPAQELNQLEIQFLLLNDFRLMISLEELQRYGDQLLKYWSTEMSPLVSPELKGIPPWVSSSTRGVKDSNRWMEERANVQTTTAPLGADT